MLAGVLMIEILAAEGASDGIMLLAAPDMTSHARTAGLHLVVEGASIVAPARDIDLTYPRLHRAGRRQPRLDPSPP